MSVRFLFPEDKSNEIAGKIFNIIYQGKYLNLSESCNIIDDIVRDISYLPVDTQLFCGVLLDWVAGNSLKLQHLSEEYVNEETPFDLAVITNIVSGLLSIGDFTYSRRLIEDLWCIYGPKIITTNMMWSVLGVLGFNTLLNDMMKYYEKMNLNEDGLRLCSYLKSLPGKEELSHFDFENGVKMLDVAGNILKKHSKFSSGINIQFDHEGVLGIFININSSIEEYLIMDDELSDALFAEFSNFPENISVGFWPLAAEGSTCD